MDAALHHGPEGGQLSGSVCIAFPWGCPRSQVEAARLFDYFAANDWQIVDSVRHSDLVVVSGCAVAQKAEDVSLETVANVARARRPDSRLLVVGCIAGIVDERLREEFGAIVVPPVSMSDLDAVIGARVPIADIHDPNYLAPYLRRARLPLNGERKTAVRRAAGKIRAARRHIAPQSRRTAKEFVYLEPLHNVHSIRVAAGCLEECTYCAIRVAVGSLRSKPLARVGLEFDEGLALGRTEFKLIGADVGAYGQDLGVSCVDLLECLFSRPGDFRLTIHDFHPRWLVQYEDVLVPLLAANADRVRLLILPVQSGSERILTRMGRSGTAAELTHSLESLQTAAPGMALATHVLVGFPGETDDDLDETRRLLDRIHFARVDIYRYADRPKTAAATFSGKMSEDVKAGRVERLLRELPTAREFT
jgi:tRNA A37 methylthiotransferase MiaB